MDKLRENLEITEGKIAKLQIGLRYLSPSLVSSLRLILQPVVYTNQAVSHIIHSLPWTNRGFRLSSSHSRVRLALSPHTDDSLLSSKHSMLAIPSSVFLPLDASSHVTACGFHSAFHYSNLPYRYTVNVRIHIFVHITSISIPSSFDHLEDLQMRGVNATWRLKDGETSR